MSPARAVTIIATLAIPAALWGFLNAAKHDVLTFQRALIRQVRAADAEYRGAGPSLEAGDRLARVQSRFFLRYRHPEEPPDAQELLFGGLWYYLARAEPESCAYGDRSPQRDADGRAHPRREVLIDSADRKEEPVKLAVDWVQYRGSWYIGAYRIDGEEPARYR